MKNSSSVILLYTFVKKQNVEVLDPIKVLVADDELDIQISPLGIKSRRLNENNFEVIGECNITGYCVEYEEPIIDIAMEYSGIFKLNCDALTKRIVYVDCANILYPFLRSEIILLSAKMGLNPIHLPYINFEEQFYRLTKSISSKKAKPLPDHSYNH